MSLPSSRIGAPFMKAQVPGIFREPTLNCTFCPMRGGLTLGRFLSSLFYFALEVMMTETAILEVRRLVALQMD